MDGQIQEKGEKRSPGQIRRCKLIFSNDIAQRYKKWDSKEKKMVPGNLIFRHHLRNRKNNKGCFGSRKF